MKYYIPELDTSFSSLQEAEGILINSDDNYEVIYWNKNVVYDGDVKTIHYHYIGIPNEPKEHIKNYTIIKEGEN